MQRSAAAAKEAGVDFEHLAAMIAVISERTRLDPEVIGTSLQAMFSRLHMIRKSGYSDDGGSTNQIEDALSRVNEKLGTSLSLFEAGGREWRDAQDVFEDIAAVWNKMDGTLKALVTTAIAGTRQQDRFLNLMHGMSSASGEANRYQELLRIGMTSTGATAQKYAIRMESVGAAQDHMKASAEKLYSTLGGTNALKGFYDTMSSLLNALAKGIPSVGGQIAIFAGVVTSLIVVGLRAYKLVKSFQTLLSTSKIGVILSAIGAAAAAITMLSGASIADEKPARDPMEVFAE